MLFDLHPYLVAAFTGFLSAFILSVPVGPVNLTIINCGARHGLLWALMTGLGAVSMEVIYCALAFTGFAAFFDTPIMKAAMELASFVLMIYLGVVFLRARKIEMAPTSMEDRLKMKFHPRSAFAVGFVQVMANLGVFAGWIVLAASFISHGWVERTWTAKLFCVAGVAAGTSLWFSGLSYAVSRGHGKFTEKTLLRMEHISGVCMLLLALYYGCRMAWQMSQHRI
jgi:threonine/homoserine/homoserine lactone efflux protein